MTRRVCEACGNRPAEGEHLRRCRTCRRKGRRPVEAGARILVIDIETAPNLVYTWGLHGDYVSPEMIVEPTRMLCFAAKWVGDDHVDFWSECDEGRPSMLGAAWSLLDKADAVVHYNGKRFDVPHLNREFATAGLTPPSPFQEIDLLSAVKRRFRFPSNKLQHVSQAFGLGGKVEHEGIRLWRKCLAGDADAWRRMEKYNRQDVVLTEEVYQILLPWIPGHPNLRLYVEDGAGCPTCGGGLTEDGFYYTRVSRFQQYRCLECGRHSRGSRRIGGVDIQEAVR